MHRAGRTLARSVLDCVTTFAQVDQFGQRQPLRAASAPFADDFQYSGIAQGAQQIGNGLPARLGCDGKPDVRTLEDWTLEELIQQRNGILRMREFEHANFESFVKVKDGACFRDIILSLLNQRNEEELDPLIPGAG